MGILCLALLGLSSALVCPDGGICQDTNTCCKNTMGGYGCCPLPHAECCSDHLHCCFEGTLCDLVHEKCVNKTVSLPWMTRLPTSLAPLVPQLEERVKAVICPDQESECPDATTCCQLPDSSWGCCPLAKVSHTPLSHLKSLAQHKPRFFTPRKVLHGLMLPDEYCTHCPCRQNNCPVKSTLGQV